MRLHAFSLGLCLVCLSCGRTEQKVELKNRLLEESKDPNCKPSLCPEIDYKLVDSSGVDVAGKVFEGVQNSNVEWTVKIKSNAPAGRVKIVLKVSPDWLDQRDSDRPGSIQLVGLPKMQVDENTVTILARDMARCAALEKVSKDCSNSEVPLPKYDKQFTLKYSIKSSSP